MFLMTAATKEIVFFQYFGHAFELSAYIFQMLVVRKFVTF